MAARDLLLAMMVVLGVTGCGRSSELTSYRVAANLVPDLGDTCGECSVALVLDAVRVDGVESRPRRFLRDLDGFHFSWGVEQVVQVERWQEQVPAGLMDDNGVRERVVRVLETRPLPASSPFEMRFGRFPPGSSTLRLESESGAVRLADYGTSVLIECPDPAVCQTLAGMKLGEQAFTLELTHAASEGGPLLAHALRLDP